MTKWNNSDEQKEVKKSVTISSSKDNSNYVLI